LVLEMGDRPAFEVMLARHGESLERHDLNNHIYFNISAHAMRAILGGEFAEAECLAERAFEAGREFSSEYADGVYGVQMFTIRREQGRLAEVAPYRDLAVIAPATTVCCGSAGRYLGMLAATLGDWTAAEEHFATALAMDERLGAWPWLAHTKHEFALMLRRRGGPRDHARAAELIAAAAASAERIGMPALQQKIRSLSH
jgi:hypothetical protein